MSLSATAQNERVVALEEVVVTATKRSESLQDVPMTITVLTEEDIRQAGITKPSDFLNSIPNVTFLQDSTGESFVNIRGQTSSRNSDPNVAIVVDGVTMSSMRTFYQDLLDVEQIEILKGPQSALYGRNAAAGAIIINTKPPSDELEGSVSLGAGNFNSSSFQASLGGPISDTLKFRVSASTKDTDGPWTGVNSGEKVARYTPKMGRVRLLYEPNENMSVDFKYGTERTKGGSLSAANAQVVGLPIGSFPATELDANFADMPFVTNVTGLFDQTYHESTLKVDYNFGSMVLTSITSWTDLDTYWGGDVPPYIPDTGMPGSALSGYSYLDENISQEFRLTSETDSNLQWQIGMYALSFKRDQYSEFNDDLFGSVPATRNKIDGPEALQPTTSFGNQYYTTDSTAVFANIQYDITDTLQVRLAGRYDKEERDVEERAPDEINPYTGQNYNLCVELTGRSKNECRSSNEFEQFQPKVVLSWSASSNINLYASYGEGFKAGGFNPLGGREAIIAAAIASGQDASSVYVEESYDKELSESLELGAKLQFLDNRLSINFAAFQTDIEGAQQYEFVPTVGLQTTVSIDEVEVRGFDLDFKAALPGQITVFGGYGYTDGEIKNFAANPIFNGNVAPNSFKYNAILGAIATIDLPRDFTLTPRVEWNRLGPIWWDIANSPGTKRDPVDLLKARVTLASEDGWEFSVWGDNLTDEKYFKQVVAIINTFTVNFQAPTRTYGVEISKRF
ncbi:TonB-dependent receptor [Haliea sp. E1-2-M8]|nr:TonB-dependent receptor [Haliea sp. E1-2-M8]